MLFQNILLIAFPEGLACLLASLYLLEGRPPWKRPVWLLLFAGFYAPFSMLSVYLIFARPEFHFAGQLALSAFIIVIMRAFICRSWGSSVLYSALFLSINGIVSYINPGLEFLFTGGYSNYFDTPFENLLHSWWPVYVLEVLAAYHLSRGHYGDLFRRLARLGEEKSMLLISLIIIFQYSIITGALLSFSVLADTASNIFITRNIAIVASFFTYFVVGLIIIACSVNLAAEVAVHSYEDMMAGSLQKVSLALKVARHDFIHHVQVLDILYRDGELEEFRDYLARIEADLNDSAPSCSPLQPPGDKEADEYAV